MAACHIDACEGINRMGGGRDPDPLTRSTFDGAPVLYFCIDISCRKFLFFTASEWQRKFQSARAESAEVVDGESS